MNNYFENLHNYEHQIQKIKRMFGVFECLGSLKILDLSKFWIFQKHFFVVQKILLGRFFLISIFKRLRKKRNFQKFNFQFSPFKKETSKEIFGLEGADLHKKTEDFDKNNLKSFLKFFES